MVVAASELILQRMQEEEEELERTKEAREAAQKAAEQKKAKREALEKAERESVLAELNDPHERLRRAVEMGDADGVYLTIKRVEREEDENSGSLVDLAEGKLSVTTLVNHATPDGATPLYMACKKGFAECADHLLRSGAIANRATQAGGFTPLWIACAKGHLECVKLIMRQRGIVADQKAIDGRTPLYAACESGSLPIVELLLNQRCDIEANRNDNSTPLIVASVFGHHAVVELLLERGALLRPRDEDGTAIDNARRQNKTRCLQLLEAAMSERGVLERGSEAGVAVVLERAWRSYTTLTTQEAK